MSDAFPLLVVVGFSLVMWVLFIRPQSARRRELSHLQATLEVGDEVMLTSGVYGVLRELGDTDVQVEIADGVTIRVARGAVGRVEPDEPDHQHDHDHEHDETADDDVSEEN